MKMEKIRRFVVSGCYDNVNTADGLWKWCIRKFDRWKYLTDGERK